MPNYNYNIYSPKDDGAGPEEFEPDSTEDEAFIDLLQEYAEKIQDIDIENATGSFTHRRNDKKQHYSMKIESINDVIVIACMLVDRDLLNGLAVPDGFERTYVLFNHAGMYDSTFVNLFRKKLKKWIKPKKGGYSYRKLVKNPITKRFITKTGKAYKDLFGKIKLKDVVYSKLQNFYTHDYVVTGYCVPSYLKSKLCKNEYKSIEDELNKLKTPTYPELTTMLNKINYNLNVFITDNECIQEQTEHKKKIHIMIHNEHMYVLSKGMKSKIKGGKINQIENKDFCNARNEIYTEYKKIINQKVCVPINVTADIKKFYRLHGEFNQVNIDFFENCDKSNRYFDKSLKYGEGIDINKCYPNILNNPKYVFPISTGREITEKYEPKMSIRQASFYFIEFIKPTEIQKILFGNKCWILGDLILKLKLKSNINIKYIHRVYNCQFGEKTKFDYDKLILYTGQMCKYKSQKTKMIECKDVEAEAYRAKYEGTGAYYVNDRVMKNRRDLTTYTEYGHIEIVKQHLLSTSGMYAYLAIIQYARLQLYQIYTEAKLINKNIKVKKVYTDCITFDIKLKEDDKYVMVDNKKKSITEIKLHNICFKKYGFGIKFELSLFSWKDLKKNCIEPIPYVKKEINNFYDINELLKKKVSFNMNARGGYGKSYQLNNIVIPYLKRKNKKYIISSTTIESSKLLNCSCVHSILLSKKSSLRELNKLFADIDYFIVDECTRLNMPLLNVIGYLKKMFPKLVIIFSGDMNQCSFGLFDITDTEEFKRLTDYNMFKIKWHPHARYDEDYDIFLDGLLKFENGGRDKKCIEYILDFFNDSDQRQVFNDGDEDNNNMKLCYTHAKGAKIKNYMTVHKAQGQTIDNMYSIYEITKMDMKILYTAFSRGVCKDCINIYIKNT
jgi:hypothetical protein